MNLKTWEYFLDEPLLVRARIVLQVIRSEMLLVATIPFALLAVFLMVLLRPLVLIRVGLLRSDRIGHFTANHEIFLCNEKLLGPVSKRTFDVYFLGSIPPCNGYLAELWKGALRVWPRSVLRPISLILRAFRPLRRHVCGEPAFSTQDSNNSLDLTDPTLQISDVDRERGAQEIERLGIPRGSRYVCFVVRDPAYLERLYGTPQLQHDYRNASINSFNDAALWLADQGVYVLRMGSIAKERWNLHNKLIIDYAFSDLRSDFLDIFLMATCDFCVSTNTGLDGVSQIFRRPIAYVNSVPVGLLQTYSRNSILLTKAHYSDRLDRRLTLNEIFRANVGFATNSREFADHGVRLIENTPAEILEVVKEMFARVNNRTSKTARCEDLQSKFRLVFANSLSEQQRTLHPNPVANYSCSALMNDENWLT